MKNLAVIQVRTDSTRLPGKAMLPLSGIPMIGYMINRLKSSRLINKLIVATTSSVSDDQLSLYTNSLGIDTYRGSENDVLARVYAASKKYNPLTLIRLTGDCPLIDVGIVDNLIEKYYTSKAEYSWVHESFAEGLDAEAISFKALSLCLKNSIYNSEREHITQYIHNNKDKFKIVPLLNSTDDSNIRIVVDEPRDYDLVSIITKHFDREFNSKYYSFKDIKRYLNENPELLEINANIIRNEGLKISKANDFKI
ncbi:glycosyltransferase family protein [Prochlorococcus sp. MIT 1223]|uniref:glycosyltransferase family protein n=1 Tax=Prochlorococcus sp. MIT 1223 TaxID=3096217 RepID=UPI002A74E83E|nr:glycosyltransferase family protein [Prochlorococcus sp. MIT 1223]